MRQEQLKITINRSLHLLVSIGIGFVFLALFSYIYQLITINGPKSKTPIQQQQNISPVLAVNTFQPTPTPVVSDYRTVLLLRRATDLIVTYIDKVQAGEIAPDDNSARQPYTMAYPVAIDAYNHTTPSIGMENAWRNVTIVVTAYYTVYPIIQQGNPISINDLFRLKSYRQFLTNYKNTLESILTNRGTGSDFFAAEQQAVDTLLQENYGDIPLPTAIP
jgi:hypothetical protein